MQGLDISPKECETISIDCDRYMNTERELFIRPCELRLKLIYTYFCLKLVTVYDEFLTVLVDLTLWYLPL